MENIATFRQHVEMEMRKLFEAVEAAQKLADSLGYEITITKKNCDPSTVPQKAQTSSRKGKKYGRLGRHVMDAITAQQGTFTIHTIITWIKEKNPTLDIHYNSIHRVIDRLCNKSAIRVISKGSGKRAGTYERVQK